MKTYKRYFKKIELFNKRIEAGVKWLNKNKPGWEKTIDLERLDLSDGDVCILGQGFKNFWGDMEATIKGKKVKLSVKETQDMGFFIPDSVGGNPDYDLLTQLWFHKILNIRMGCK